MAIREIGSMIVEPESEEETKGRLYDFLFHYFQVNPTPTDDQVHALAHSVGEEPEHFERVVYQMLADIVEEVGDENAHDFVDDVASFDEGESDHNLASTEEDSSAWADKYSNDSDLEETNPQILMTSVDRIGTHIPQDVDFQEDAELSDQPEFVGGDEPLPGTNAAMPVDPVSFAPEGVELSATNPIVEKDKEKEGLFHDGKPDLGPEALDTLVQHDGEVEPKVESPNDVPFAADDGAT